MKLVRDRIPEIIEESGKTCKCSVIKEIGEFQERLFEKMQEEMMEQTPHLILMEVLI